MPIQQLHRIIKFTAIYEKCPANLQALDYRIYFNGDLLLYSSVNNVNSENNVDSDTYNKYSRFIKYDPELINMIKTKQAEIIFNINNRVVKKY